MASLTNASSEVRSNAGLARSRRTVEHVDRLVGRRGVNPVFQFLKDFNARSSQEMVLQLPNRRLAVHRCMRECLEVRIIHYVETGLVGALTYKRMLYLQSILGLISSYHHDVGLRGRTMQRSMLTESPSAESSSCLDALSVALFIDITALSTSMLASRQLSIDRSMAAQHSAWIISITHH